MDYEKQKALLRRIVRREVELVIGDSAKTDGEQVMIFDAARRFPGLPPAFCDLLETTCTAHEGVHNERWIRDGKKLGRKPLTAKEFNELFADPVSPDKESLPFTRKLLNLVEDAPVDAGAASYVGQAAMDETNRFFVWNRQGGRRQPIATMETGDSNGKCSAFIEAVFQFEVYGRLIEPFVSQELETAARLASKSLRLFAGESISRKQAMANVMDALKTYCPPPWIIPPDYEWPRDDIGNGIMPAPGKGRGDGTGETPNGKKVDVNKTKRFEDPSLEALLNMLERIVRERSDSVGEGEPFLRTWTPGDVLIDPSELAIFAEDSLRGLDPMEIRCVVERALEQHLLAVFIDSSGSVSDDLFVRLYIVMSMLADKVAQAARIKMGVGQFSGGASWVLDPTDDPAAIDALANEEPKRLYTGGTTVGEIYTILGRDFSQYKSADLVVLTDGYTEPGAQLVASLEEACKRTNCNIKLHIVVFKERGSTLRYARDAKRRLPQQVRTWHLGDKLQEE